MTTTDYNALVEAEIERCSRQWEKTEDRLIGEIEKWRGRVRELELIAAGVEAEVPWFIKDFHVLYRAALDVSESIVEPDRETPSQRHLRAQLARLRPAFGIVEEMRKREGAGGQ
jgi:hypothetical protein